jgi:hypothetical protein
MNGCVCVVVDLREIGYSWIGRETRVSFAARNGRRLVVFVSFLVQQRITCWLVGWLVLDWTENRSFDSTTAHHTRGRNEVRFSSEATRNYPKTNSFASIVHPRIRDLYTHDVRSDGAAVCGNNVSPGRIHETG